MKLLLVTLYFPPAGGGGVQRPLKFASHLPALGIETHVLAPDDPKWVHEDADLPLPTQAWVHRARYVGPRGRRIADEQHGRTGMELALLRASAIGRRLLVPDENVTWNATAIPKAISIARQEGIDVVLTTSPPGSVHLIGAAVKRATGAKWVADLRDSLALHAHRSSDGVGARAKQKARAGIAHLVARQADAIVTAAEAITEETRGLSPRGRVVTIPNGCDFDDFAGLTYTRGDRCLFIHI
jgi:glycosyltransferase involved in cell wall biosynthesis